MRRMFSLKQLKELIANSPEEVVEALANQDLKVKTIEQSQVNEEFNIIITTNLQGCEENEFAFKKCKVINGVLYFIVETAITNNTGAPVTFSSLAFETEVSANVGKKIFKTDGKSINEYEVGQSAIVSNDQANRDSNITPLSVRCYSPNKLQPYINSFTIADGVTQNISIRFVYTLI